jgi:outer membrane protein TolC
LGTEPTAKIGVMVSQAIPYPGKRDLRAAIASRETEAEFQQIEAARLSVAARVKQSYYRLAYSYAVTHVLARNRELLDTLLKVSEVRYEVGEAAQQDVIRAQTQLTILELQRQRVDQERATREGELNALLNRPSLAPIGRPYDLAIGSFDFTIDSLIARAADRAPMLRRDRIMIDRSRAHIPSALIPIVTIPVAVAISFVPMRLMGAARTSCRLAALPLPSVP